MNDKRPYLKKRAQKRALLIFCLVVPCSLIAHVKQNKAKPGVETQGQKIIRAVRTEEPIKIDGRLTEKVWQSEGYCDFVMSDPVDGGQPTEKTSVWVAYDDANIYVAACCYDSEPKSIKSLLGRRDDSLDSDLFTFAVDPYYDRRTGYAFSVTPAGSVLDKALSNDVSEDTTWDGVWEEKTQINGKGWDVEIKIPFNQLRFPKKDEYVWGVDFRRTIKRKQERVGYVWVPKDQTAYVSRFVRLEGIKNIRPGRRFEIMPYMVGQAQFKPAEAGNPFERGHKSAGNIGFDLKIGLQSNLTLDATVNPDFGQVEVDPAVINLSAYETYYSEKRPFFIEGASLFNGFGRGGIFLNANFNWPNPTFFYSRRIGRSPEGSVSHDGFADIPDRSKILGAFKLTGKLGKDWNVGFLSALTSREYAEIDDKGLRFREELEPFSYYGVFRVQKDINEGRQGFGVMATGVVRNLRDENLSQSLNKSAFSLAFDGWTFLDKKKSWVVGGWAGGTRIAGSREDILDLQKSSMHYFQRPDAGHVNLNPKATSLSGWGFRLNLAKQQGSFLLLSSIGALSPGFDPNDVGFQYAGSDIINFSILPAYQQTKPGKILRSFTVLGGPFGNYDFGGNKVWQGFYGEFNGEFLNYWGFDIATVYNPKAYSNNRTRGGPLVAVPPGAEFDLSFYSDSRKPIVLNWFGSVYRRPSDGQDFSTEAQLRWKPRSNISFSFGPNYSRSDWEMMWVANVEDPFMTKTFGTRYIFGRLKQRTLSSEIRLNWIFTPKLSLQLYLQPYISVGKYDKFKEVARPKSYDDNVYGNSPSVISRKSGEYTVDPDGPGPIQPFSFDDPDFNMKSLRGTIVLRWEFRPGSQIYFVWTQNRLDETNPGDFRLRRNLNELFRAPSDNVFLIKVSYRWNM